MRRGGVLLVHLLLLAALALSSWWMVAVVVEAAVTLLPEDAPLIRNYYKRHNTCANMEPFVKRQVKLYWSKAKSLTTKFLKLLCAECMVNGCDASILLDGPNSEKTTPQNAGLEGFEIIDKIKIVLAARCPGVVSCADILNLATRDAAHFVGAPSYPVFLGRRDGLDSNAAWVELPSSSISLDSALNFFQSKGLDVLDMTTLLGAYSLGRTHCRYVWGRLYNFQNTGKPDSILNQTILNELKNQYQSQLKNSQSDPLMYLNPDSGPNYKFTNSYYSRTLKGESVLGVDQQLKFGNDTNQICNEFAIDKEDFRRSFTLSISRMGGLRVLTGDKGEIRRNCRYINRK